MAMALAIPTRFFIPPERDDGINFSEFSMSTSAKDLEICRATSNSFISDNLDKARPIFSSTVIESKSAPNWNTIPH